MKNRRNILIILGEWWEEKATRENVRPVGRTESRWLPTPGTIIFVVLALAALLWGQSVGAFSLVDSSANSTGTIAYQGRLADAGGNPLTSTLNMSFRLYGTATGGASLWTEQWTGSNGVQVSDGLFNVMLGSLTPIPQNVITGNPTLFLGITVGTDDEMAPRVQLGSVPFAVQALTVPDSSITTSKLTDKSVTQAKLGSDVNLIPPDGSITTAKIANSSVTGQKVLTGTLALSDLNFVAGTASIKGAKEACESYGGETHCFREVVVTHNYGSTNYFVVTGIRHGRFAHRHTVTIHSETATTFRIRATNIANNFWDDTDEILVDWLLIPTQ